MGFLCTDEDREMRQLDGEEEDEVQSDDGSNYDNTKVMKLKQLNLPLEADLPPYLLPYANRSYLDRPPPPPYQPKTGNKKPRSNSKVSNTLNRSLMES